MSAVPHERILVVDDEAGIRELVGTYLRSEGFDVDEAVDGEDAVERFRRREPDLVVLDLRLPGIDGFDVLREIRRSSSVYVIILTARTEETDKLVGLELGADDYLTKPFSPANSLPGCGPCSVGAVTETRRRPPRCVSPVSSSMSNATRCVSTTNPSS